MISIRKVQAGAQRAGALGDETRLSIALEIQRHPFSSIDRIADSIARHQSLVSRHCTRLYEAGLLDRNSTGHPNYRLSDYGQALLGLVMTDPVHEPSRRSATSSGV